MVNDATKKNMYIKQHKMVKYSNIPVANRHLSHEELVKDDIIRGLYGRIFYQLVVKLSLLWRAICIVSNIST